MRNFKELKVWVKAHQLTLSIHKITQIFPQEELSGLTVQMRRSCASIPANIADSKLEYHLLLPHELNLLGVHLNLVEISRSFWAHAVRPYHMILTYLVCISIWSKYLDHFGRTQFAQLTDHGAPLPLAQLYDCRGELPSPSLNNFCCSP